ncbi:DUF6522 family protein [Luteimonas saliphila]|uniref:DUF6522 family protein n=1 Tax=Luteimonas saliphila TaxID=2804919 RepID=UPI00192E0789|nr:DUF6522 family protein [Luteimonas saliphila]
MEGSTGRTIALDLVDRPEVEIDAALVAGGFGLDVDVFRQLMDERRIAVLCERGTGEDAGRWRASFYRGATRVRMVVEPDGTLVPGGYEVAEMPSRGGAATGADRPARA